MAQTKTGGGGGNVAPQPPVQTGGGGGGGGSTQAATPAADTPEQLVVKDRLEFVTDESFSLNPLSLVGSWFHRLENDVIEWQGVIVGEPGSGLYLCHVQRMAPGAEKVQVIVPVKAMTLADEGYEWRFYDSEAKALAAYQEWLLHEKDRV
jgi:hypothetical protein